MSDAQVRYRKRKRGPQPVACVGCREWIFSENSGALASFAAATEFTFGTIVQVCSLELFW
jgi:1,3-beta-glucan synthase component